MAVLTPTATLAFAHLFVPKPRSIGKEPDYNCVLLFDEEAQASAQWKAMGAAAAEAIDKEFGPGKSRDAAFVKSLNKLPFTDALEKSKYAGFTAGKKFISPWTKTKPGIVDGNLSDVLAPADLWAGQLVRATVMPFAYTYSGKKGVAWMLNNVQILDANQPRLDGRANANQDFEKVPGAADTSAADDNNALPF